MGVASFGSKRPVSDKTQEKGNEKDEYNVIFFAGGSNHTDKDRKDGRKINFLLLDRM